MSKSTAMCGVGRATGVPVPPSFLKAYRLPKNPLSPSPPLYPNTPLAASNSSKSKSTAHHRCMCGVGIPRPPSSSFLKMYSQNATHSRRVNVGCLNFDPSPVVSCCVKKANPNNYELDPVVVIVDSLKKAATAIVLAFALLHPLRALALGGRSGGVNFLSIATSSTSPSAVPVLPHLFKGNDTEKGATPKPKKDDVVCVLAALTAVAYYWTNARIKSERRRREQIAHVVVLQVGFVATAPFLKALNDATASSYTDLKRCIIDITSILLRYHDDAVVAYSKAFVKDSYQEAQTLYENFSAEEQVKFGELVGELQSNQYILYTLSVIVKGHGEMPTINGTKALENAIKKIRSIPSDNVLAYEAYFIPRGDSEQLSEKQLHEQFPNLVHLKEFPHLES